MSRLTINNFSVDGEQYTAFKLLSDPKYSLNKGDEITILIPGGLETLEGPGFILPVVKIRHVLEKDGGLSLLSLGEIFLSAEKYFSSFIDKTKIDDGRKDFLNILIRSSSWTVFKTIKGGDTQSVTKILE